MALASGFSSVRRFNALVRSAYGMTPLSMRRKKADEVTGEPLTVTLAYRPPLAWNEMLAFLAARAMPGVEAVEGDAYLRTIAIGRERGWAQSPPRFDRNCLAVEISPSLLRRLPEVIVRLRNLFDLNARPDVIAAALCAIPKCVRRYAERRLAHSWWFLRIRSGRASDRWTAEQCAGRDDDRRAWPRNSAKPLSRHM